ncbi:MAG: hypothetical protein ISR58_09215 [Anaerolineales bacterium]|nr:hypothetical protein [Chloroflexota bacterium]MBL6981356.1 hypothetical protein [Anaerolineales bacterium]
MRRYLPTFFLIIGVLLSTVLQPVSGVRASQAQAATYTWQLVRWSDAQPLCLLEVNHEGLPTGVEIYTQCGAERYQEWLNTPPCTAAHTGGDTSACTGVYLRLITVTQVEGDTQDSASVENSPPIYAYALPPPEAWLDIEGCDFGNQGYNCSEAPKLVIHAQDSLPTEQIIKIDGNLNGAPFSCEGARCEVELTPTSEAGALMGFYAISSTGMSSSPYQARLRVIQVNNGWQVNVLSDRWQGDNLSSCAQIWDVFPPLGALPKWLTSPQNAADLASDVPYTYLAGQLITKGVVNAAECARLGLQGDGYANPCGLEKARAEVDTWHDRFDPQIITAANTIGIPAQLMKNLIAQESQFWPGSYYLSPEERGLGQLTPEGADTLLLWDHTTFTELCPNVMHTDTCQKGYPALAEEQQTFVQGAVMQRVDADCAHCFMGIDLGKAALSIEWFQRYGRPTTNFPLITSIQQ